MCVGKLFGLTPPLLSQSQSLPPERSFKIYKLLNDDPDFVGSFIGTGTDFKKFGFTRTFTIKGTKK